MKKDAVGPEATGIVQDLEGRVASAAEEGRGYAIVAVAPQQLPGEHISEIVSDLVARLPALVRATDIAGMVAGEALVVGMEDADRVSAAVLADRLQSDLRLWTLHIQNTAWESGIACLPDDGSRAEELLQTAIDETKTRRRRLAAL